jgi:hypothetical protein
LREGIFIFSDGPAKTAFAKYMLQAMCHGHRFYLFKIINGLNLRSGSNYERNDNFWKQLDKF